MLPTSPLDVRRYVLTNLEWWSSMVRKYLCLSTLVGLNGPQTSHWTRSKIAGEWLFEGEKGLCFCFAKGHTSHNFLGTDFRDKNLENNLSFSGLGWPSLVC